MVMVVRGVSTLAMEDFSRRAVEVFRRCAEPTRAVEALVFLVPPMGHMEVLVVGNPMEEVMVLAVAKAMGVAGDIKVIHLILMLVQI
jgi:hypothetical protein